MYYSTSISEATDGLIYPISSIGFNRSIIALKRLESVQSLLQSHCFPEDLPPFWWKLAKFWTGKCIYNEE